MFKTENGQAVFDCGCRFDILGPHPQPKSKIPLLKFNPDLRDKDCDVNFNCKATYDLMGTGLTKGLFQLESQLGKQWSRKLKPETIEHISALGAILRPGVLRAVDSENISMTSHYCRRKNKEEEFSNEDLCHESLIDILNPSYNVMIYQEQAMQIAVAVAGFNLQEADTLRKAIGKKLPEEMTKVRKLFLEKCKELGLITEEAALQLFDWIEQSQRYAFNHSHSMGYGQTCYVTAYQKQHFPLQFFRSWLEFAKDKQEPMIEIRELVQDAKLFDIEVCPPDICLMRPNFYTDGQTIFFGLTDIKGVGEKQFAKLVEKVKECGFDFNKNTWFDFLLQISDGISSTVVENLIVTGALRCFGVGRQRMLAEFNKWQELTDGEKNWIRKAVIESGGKCNNLSLSLKILSAGTKKNGGGCHTEKRVNIVTSLYELLDNPPTSIDDTCDWIVNSEEEFLGIALTNTKLDNYDTIHSTTNCRDIVKGFKGYTVLAVEIKRTNIVKTKKGKTPGQNMAFLNICDESGEMDSVVAFPQVYEEFKDLLVQNNFVYIRGKMTEQNSLSIEKVYQMEKK